VLTELSRATSDREQLRASAATIQAKDKSQCPAHQIFSPAVGALAEASHRSLRVPVRIPFREIVEGEPFVPNVLGLPATLAEKVTHLADREVTTMTDTPFGLPYGAALCSDQQAASRPRKRAGVREQPIWSVEVLYDLGGDHYIEPAGQRPFELDEAVEVGHLPICPRADPAILLDLLTR
jgi:hypothetical protein